MRKNTMMAVRQAEASREAEAEAGGGGEDDGGSTSSTRNMDGNEGSGNSFDEASALQRFWNGMGKDQRAARTWGGHRDQFMKLISQQGYENAAEMRAGINRILLADTDTVLDYVNDDIYQQWLRASKFDDGVEGFTHTGQRRSMYDTQAPSEWVRLLGLETTPKETGTGEEVDTEEPTETLDDANKKAATKVASERPDATDIGFGKGITYRTQLDDTVADTTETVAERSGATDIGYGPGITYRTPYSSTSDREFQDFTGDDIVPGPFRPEQVADQPDDAPGSRPLTLNMPYQAKQAREMSQGILRPGYPGYDEAQSRLRAEETRASLAKVTQEKEAAKAAEVAQHVARIEEQNRINALKADPDFNYSQITNPGYYSEQNQAIRDAVAGAPLAAHEALQDVSLYDSANRGTEAISDFTGSVARTVADDPTVLVPSTASAAVQALGSGIQQAYGSTIGAAADWATERYQERREEEAKQQQAIEAQRTTPLQMYPEDFAEGGQTSSDRISIVGEEGRRSLSFQTALKSYP